VEIKLNIKVLVVDDNQINRLLINKILTKWGVVADFAVNGIEAISKIEATPNFDVILMDIHMPQMGGPEATKILRAKPEPYFQNVPIIALTAAILTNGMNEIAVAGMTDFIIKPFEPNILFEKLSKYQRL
jgi:CheY-like chemotaxis protein